MKGSLAAACLFIALTLTSSGDAESKVEDLEEEIISYESYADPTDPLEYISKPGLRRSTPPIPTAPAGPTAPTAPAGPTVSQEKTTERQTFNSENPSDQQTDRANVPACDCDLENNRLIDGGSTDDVVFMKRIVSSILGHINKQESSSGHYTADLTIRRDDINLLAQFVNSADGRHIQEASESLVNSINSIEGREAFSTSPYEWLVEQKSVITAVLQVLLIILLTLVLLLVTVKLWWGIGAYRFLFLVTVLLFCVSVPWTWVHLYKKNLAGRFKRAGNDLQRPPAECEPSRLPWTQFMFMDSSKCAKYYEDQLIDPLWEVKPTQAIAITVVEFIWNPLAIMGQPLGTFIRDVLEPLPFWMKPAVAILGLMFAWWCLVLMSGMKVWTWFFIVEPANTAQHELAAINRTVSDLQEGIRMASDSHTQRDSELKSIVKNLGDQVEAQNRVAEVLPVMGEMIPVLQNMCADYALGQNTGQRVPERALHGAGDTGYTGDSGTQTVTPDIHTSIANLAFNVARPDHVVLTTSNADTIVDFYTSIGMTLKTFGAGRKALHFQQFKINIHNAGSEVMPHASNPAPGCLDICFVCNCTVETTLTYLKSKNVTAELGPVPRTGAMGPVTSVYLRDPDSNLIELAHYSSGETTASNIQTLTTTSDS